MGTWRLFITWAIKIRAGKAVQSLAWTILRLAGGRVPSVRCLHSSLLIAAQQELGSGARGCAACLRLGARAET